MPEPEDREVEAAGRRVVGERGGLVVRSVDVDRDERRRRRQPVDELAAEAGVAAGRVAGRQARPLVEQHHRRARRSDTSPRRSAATSSA